jgi:hypothetical protein
MSLHRFRVGDRVEFAANRQDSHVTPGTYTIIMRMPGDAVDPQYRVKSANDLHQRVMNESQLRKS